tara:strand:+ start:2184 stop:2396 length:213 start_codon:yes stop_codon:yes gene_type:complete
MDDIKSLISTDEFKANLCNKINRHIDIPLVGENTEGVVFRAIIDVLIATINDEELKNEKSLGTFFSLWCD